MSVSRPNNVVSVGCLNPIKAPKNSKLSYYPCGKCPHCLLTKSLRNSRSTLLEMMNEYGKRIYPLFVLLTYDNEHIPLVRIQYRKTQQNSFVVDIIDLDTGEYLKESVHFSSKSLYTIHKHAKKQNLRSIGIFPEPIKERGTFYFAVTSNKDLQKFFKRIRSRLSRKKLGNFRYAACSEYGPNTNRAHYHVLFFCESEEQRKFISCQIKNRKNSVWKLGNSNSLYYTGSGADYICSYINGIAISSPLLKRIPEFRPRFFHSNQLGFRGCRTLFGSIRETYSRKPSEWLSGINCYCNGNPLNILPLHNYVNTLYPKCLRYDCLSIWERCKSYAAAFRFYKKFSVTKLASLSYHEFLNNDEYNDFVQLVELALEGVKLNPYSSEFVDMTEDGKYKIIKHKRKDLTELILNRIRSFIRISFKTFSNLITIYGKSLVFSNRLPALLYDYVRYIDELYKTRNYNNLVSQLSKQEQISQYYTWADIATQFYDNTIDDGLLDNLVPSLNSRLQSEHEYYRDKSPLRANYKSYCIMKQNDATKHKKIKERTTLNQFYAYGK